MLFLATLGLVSSLPAQALVNVLTYHHDQARTGANLAETKLTPANVNATNFGRWFSDAVDGYVFAQPLILTAVPVPGRGVMDLVFIATEHDSVYAFDANNNDGVSAGPVWMRSFINPEAGITAPSAADMGISEPPELGLTGTPVIDPVTRTLYVVVKTKEGPSQKPAYFHRLHALDVATGQEKFGGPVVIDASIAGQGDSNNGHGQVLFNSLREFQRPGLVLADGFVYVAFASAGDIDPYHGWVLGYDARTLQLVRIFNDTPDGGEGGIWMSGAAPAVDEQGNIYCITGNGTFDGVRNFGDSFLRLKPDGTNLVAADYFAPFNQAALSSVDGDVGSGGCLLLPDEAGSASHPHLITGCGKEGTIYLMDRDNMGHFHAGDDSQIVQSLPDVIGGNWGMPAYFNGWLYIQGNGDYLKAFAISNARLSLQPVSQTAARWSYPNGTPSISANGTNDAIAWIVQANTFYQNAPPILHAYKATDLSQELYNSKAVSAPDQIGLAQRFTVPVIANGKVYMASAGMLTVFGNLEPPVIVRQPEDQLGIPGDSVRLRVTASGAGPLFYQWQFGEANIEGATNATLVLANAGANHEGRYAVTVSNAFGSVSSDAAAVVLVERPRVTIDSDFELSLTGRAGLFYRIEYSDTLGPNADWQLLLNLLFPDSPSGDSAALIRDPLPAPAQRFYRVVVTFPQYPVFP